MPSARRQETPTATAPEPAVKEAGFAAAARGYGAVYSADLDESEIIQRYMPTVKAIAAHLKGRLSDGVQLDDLVQAGLIAVLRLMRRGGIAPGQDAQLGRSILNAMIDEARREAWAPVRIIRVAKAAARAIRAVERRLGRPGTDEEIAAELGVPLAEYHQLLTEVAGIRLLSLDGFDETEERLQTRNEQEEALHRSRVVADLAQAIERLPAREKIVISLYYEQELNMDEVGRVLGLDKSTVCRAHGRALLMLRGALGGRRDAPAQPLSLAEE